MDKIWNRNTSKSEVIGKKTQGCDLNIFGVKWILKHKLPCIKQFVLG